VAARSVAACVIDTNAYPWSVEPVRREHEATNDETPDQGDESGDEGESDYVGDFGAKKNEPAR
jgi:hypothetical protein